MRELAARARLVAVLGCAFVIVGALLWGAPAARAGTTGRLTGRVTDAKGSPLPGVNVQIPAARTGALTDEDGRFDRSLVDVRGEALVVSQFTLFADTSRGRRPGFTGAAGPEAAERLYQRFAASLREHDVRVETGRFGAEMAVELVNDGPFTIWLDTAER